MQAKTAQILPRLPRHCGIPYSVGPGPARGGLLDGDLAGPILANGHPFGETYKWNAMRTRHRVVSSELFRVSGMLVLLAR